MLIISAIFRITGPKLIKRILAEYRHSFQFYVIIVSSKLQYLVTLL